jgi:hypothetical protein
MNTKSLTANMLSRLKESLDSWISLWRFLANLHDLDFYQGLEDPQREICLGLSDSTPTPILPILSFKKRREIPRAVYDTNDFEFVPSRCAIENQLVLKVLKTHHTEVV